MSACGLEGCRCSNCHRGRGGVIAPQVDEYAWNLVTKSGCGSRSPQLGVPCILCPAAGAAGAVSGSRCSSLPLVRRRLRSIRGPPPFVVGLHRGEQGLLLRSSDQARGSASRADAAHSGAFSSATTHPRTPRAAPGADRGRQDYSVAIAPPFRAMTAFGYLPQLRSGKRL